MDEKSKIIYDLVHGYIKIAEDTEKIINDESFQRLKYITQTTAYHLYPSANHTRFEHSLGVMKLAEDFYNRLRDQLKKKYKNEKLNDNLIKEKIHNNHSHLLFASLLHDVGHAPLSHLGEIFYSVDDIQAKIKERLSGLKLSAFDFEKLKNGSNHEWMSVLVIISNYYEKLKEIFSARKTKFDHEYIARIITGNKYEDSDEFAYWDRDVVISIVNSETIDVDKLDYLMRDNFMSGMVGPKVDIERLLYSLIITQKKQLGFSKAGVSTIQKIIECRDSIYLWVYNHHTVVYTDYLIQECIKHMGKLYEFSKDSNNEPPKFINKKNVYYKNDKLRQYYGDYKKQEGILKIKDKINKKACISALKKTNYLPYEEAFNIEDYFSANAILEGRITDNEIYGLINKAKKLADKNRLSGYTERIISQLINRSFLKPIWKTLYEYKDFIETHFSKETQSEAIEFITQKKDENRKKIVKIICKKAECNAGEVFLIVRKNKFYFKPQLSKIYIYSYNGKKEISCSIDKLLPQKDYYSMYSEVAFYLYCKKEKKDAVSKEFTELMNNYKKINSIYKQYFGES